LRVIKKRDRVHGNILCIFNFHCFILQNSKAQDPERLEPQKCRDVLSRKEVIQPQVLLRLPCYDFTPIMNHTLDGCPLAVGSPASSAVHFRDVTGGVYKARERIHRGVLIRDY
jgi:hypothetical protein